MRSKFILIWIIFLLLAQACAPAEETVPPAPTQVPTIPRAGETAFPMVGTSATQTGSSLPTVTDTPPQQPSSSLPTLEPTLPQVMGSTQVIILTPRVSTAISGPTLGALPPPPATVTPFTGVSDIPKGSLTMQDNGGTFRMKVGESFLLNLGLDGYDWTVSIGDENILRLRAGVMVIKGAQGIFEALAPGTTSFAASGDPVCLKSTPPCMMPSILFEITVIVE